MTTRRDRSACAAPDLVDRNFVADKPNALWVADITDIPTWAGFLYLAVVLDVWSGKIVGWPMESHLRTSPVTAALVVAIKQRFFATLECELLNRSHFRTHDEARDAIFEFIEGFYNTRRRPRPLAIIHRVIMPSPAELFFKSRAGVECPRRGFGRMMRSRVRRNFHFFRSHRGGNHMENQREVSKLIRAAVLLAACLWMREGLAATADSSAQGQLTVDGKTITLRHAYAVAGPDTFDGTKEAFLVLLTEKPLAAGAIKGSDSFDELGGRASGRSSRAGWP